MKTTLRFSRGGKSDTTPLYEEFLKIPRAAQEQQKKSAYEFLLHAGVPDALARAATLYYTVTGS